MHTIHNQTQTLRKTLWTAQINITAGRDHIYLIFGWNIQEDL
jgi:hypothetical protein